jgi:Zn-finger nucleic acid-binding protein
MTQIVCPTCKGTGWIDQLDADALDYLKRYPDVAASSFKNNPRAHYDQYGKKEGRTWGTSLDADAQDYLRRYPDVAAIIRRK